MPNIGERNYMDSRISNNQRGFSLVELLISVVVFLIATAAIFGVVRIGNLQRNTVNSRADQLRGVRIALDYVRRDALNAGLGYHRTGGNIPDNVGDSLFSLPMDGDTQRDLLTAVMAANNVNASVLNPSGAMDRIVFINRDASFNGGATVNYSSATKSGDNINIQTTANISTICKQYDTYLFESANGTTQIIGMVTFVPNATTLQLASSDPLGLNQSANGVNDNQSLFVSASGAGSIKKINIVSYSVNGEGILVRKTYGNQTDKNADQQIEARELVYGVSDFQVRYFLEDGTTVDDPSGGNNGRDNQIKMNSVVQIQVTVTLAPDVNSNGTPIVMREFISTKNLRYEAS